MCLSKSDRHTSAGDREHLALLLRRLRRRTRGSVVGRWGVGAAVRWWPVERSRVQQRVQGGAGQRGSGEVTGRRPRAPGAQGKLACGAPSRQAAGGALYGTLKASAPATCTWRARPRGRNRKRPLVRTSPPALRTWVKGAGALKGDQAGYSKQVARVR